MVPEWDDYYSDNEELDLVKRYHEMRRKNKVYYFDQSEFESIIEYYLNEYDYQEAHTVVSLALDQHPYSLSVKLKYVQILIETGKPARALRMIRSVERIEQSNYQIYLFKGISQVLTGKYQEALPNFDRSLYLCTDGKDEVAYSIAQSFLQIDKLHDANKYLQLSYNYNRSNILALYDLALNYESLGMLEKCVECYNKYLDIDPFAEHIWNNLGLIYTKMGAYEKAMEAFDFATTINPNYFTAYLNQTDTLLSKNDFEGAIAVCKNVIEQDANNSKALCSLANCYMNQRNYKEALRNLNTAISLEHDCSEAYYGKSVLMVKMKKFSQGLVSIKKAIAIEPENGGYWFMLGEIHTRMRKYSMATEAYIRAVELDPSDHEAWLAYAQIMFRKKKVCEAIDILAKSYEHINKNSTLHYRLAAYHAYQQDFTKAIEYFELGLKLNYKEYQEMFRLFPKTRECGFFYNLIEKHQHSHHNINN